MPIPDDQPTGTSRRIQKRDAYTSQLPDRGPAGCAVSGAPPPMETPPRGRGPGPGAPPPNAPPKRDGELRDGESVTLGSEYQKFLDVIDGWSRIALARRGL